MAVNNTTPGPGTSRRAGARLRTIGLVVLLLGLGGAVLRYGLSAPSKDSSADLPTAETSKKVARDIEVNFGKMGLLTNSLAENLQDPATQALIIVVASIVVAFGCFYVAHLQDRADESDGTAD
jgi:hypothetical protein